MSSGLQQKELNWERVYQRFMNRIEATREHKTWLWYKDHLGQMARWAGENQVQLSAFTSEHLDIYLIERSKMPGQRGLRLSETTMRHDQVACKAFFRWMRKERLIIENPFDEYTVRKPARRPQYVPSREEVEKLLRAVKVRWSLTENPMAKYRSESARAFFAKRNYAILLVMADTAARVGEVLALEFADYESDYFYINDSGTKVRAPRLVIQKAKGRKSREIPLSHGTYVAIEEWLECRREAAYRDDPHDPPACDKLFFNEYSEPMDENPFLRSFSGYVKYAGCDPRFTTHCFRRFRLSELVWKNFWAAVLLAGHSDPKTTKGYTEFSFAPLHSAHAELNTLMPTGKVPRRAGRKKRV